MSTSPFDDIAALMADLPGPNLDARDRAAEREGRLVKPVGSLGRLEEIIDWLSAWRGVTPPTVMRPVIALYAGAHGVAARGVSAFRPSFNRQSLEMIAARQVRWRGRSGILVLLLP